MKLGVSWWGFAEEIDECTGVDTPDGGRYTRPLLMKELYQRGHELYTLQKQRGDNTLDFLIEADGDNFYNKDSFPDIDALFLEWRWPTYKNDRTHPDFGERNYEPDWDRQRELMRHYTGQVPIIIFDTDLKYNPINSVPKGVKVFEPAIHTRDFADSLLYWTDFNHLFRPRPHNNVVLYLGSNYERYWAVEKYYLEAAKELQDEVEFHFFGNWLDKSPERPEQEQKVKEYSEYINFHERNTMQEGFELLSKAITTIHIGKKKYMEKGVITPRYLESIACGTPALIPEEFNGDLYGDQYRVKNAEDVVERIRFLKTADKYDRRKIVNLQARNIRKNQDVRVSQAADKIIGAIKELL